MWSASSYPHTPAAGSSALFARRAGAGEDSAVQERGLGGVGRRSATAGAPLAWSRQKGAGAPVARGGSRLCGASNGRRRWPEGGGSRGSVTGGRRSSSTAGAPLVGSRQKGAGAPVARGGSRVAAARSLECTLEGGGSRGSGTASPHSWDAATDGCGEHPPPSPVRRRSRSPAVSACHCHLSAAGREHAPPLSVCSRPRLPAVSTRHRHLSWPPRESPNRI